MSTGRKKTYTHRGFLEGCDARTPRAWQCRTVLRETKLHWVTPHGERFRKDTGRGMGDWPMRQLGLATVKPLNEPVRL